MSTKPSTTILETSSSTRTCERAALDEILKGLGHGDLELFLHGIEILERTSGDTVTDERFADSIRALRETMWSFRKDLDPSLVTMTSTNIPDALKKLEEVLKSSAEATRKVLTLVEQQDEIIAKGDTYLAELEASASEHRADADTLRTFIARYRDLNERARDINLEMVMAHEFQDLCGQSIKKVLLLLQGIEGHTRALLNQFKIELPDLQTPLQSQSITSQSDVDKLLEEHR